MAKKIRKNNFKIQNSIRRLCKLLAITFFVLISTKIYFVCAQNLESEEELQALKKKLSNLTAENKNLEQQLKTGLNYSFVEQTARDKLKMVSPHERVFYNVTVED